MDLSPVNPGGRTLIQAYGEGGFRISGRRYDGSVLVFEDRTVALAIEEFSEIMAADFEPLEDAAEEVEILLLGCGAVSQELDPDLRARLKRAGISTEVMGTGAACRTFNLLQAEGRRVAALLVAIP